MKYMETPSWFYVFRAKAGAESNAGRFDRLRLPLHNRRAQPTLALRRAQILHINSAYTGASTGSALLLIIIQDACAS